MWQHFQQHQLVPKPVAPQQKDDVSIVESALMSAKGLGKFVRYIQGFVFIENLDLTNFWENKLNVHYIEV